MKARYVSNRNSVVTIHVLRTLALSAMVGCADDPSVEHLQGDAGVDGGLVSELPLDESPIPADTALYSSSWSFGSTSLLPSGGTLDRWITVGTGQILYAYALPLGTSGNIDVSVYRRDAWGVPTILVASSTDPRAGYMEKIFRTNSGAADTWLVRYRCVWGTCGFENGVSIGDTTSMITAGPYLNQRSVGTWTKCTIAGVAKPDGECMCAPTSAAMALAALGRIAVSEVRNVAIDLYSTNNADGSANRTALMNRLRAVYGMSTCNEYSPSAGALTQLQTGVRQGKLVLFRSPIFSPSGHYVRVRGYRAGPQIGVDDPYGNWVSTTSPWWSPRNTTDPASANGRERWYNWSTLASSGSSVIVCE